MNFDKKNFEILIILWLYVIKLCGYWKSKYVIEMLGKLVLGYEMVECVLIILIVILFDI